MNQAEKQRFVSNLVHRLLNVNLRNQLVEMDHTTFQQVILYMLMTEAEEGDQEFWIQLDGLMKEVQREFDETLLLLKGNG